MDRFHLAHMFMNEYQEMNEGERDKFAYVISKLLKFGYLTKMKQSDREDYYFIIEHLSVLRNYTAIMDMDLQYHEDTGVVSLLPLGIANKERLTIKESCILLILRLLYQRKMKEVSLSNQIVVLLQELHEELDRLSLSERRLTIGEMKEILTKFRRYNIIDFTSANFKYDDTMIVIYPVILYVITVQDIEEILTLLHTYQQGSDEHEASDESETD